MRVYLVTRNLFLSQEISSCHRKLIVLGEDFKKKKQENLGFWLVKKIWVKKKFCV